MAVYINRGVLPLKDLCLFSVHHNLTPSNVYVFYLETLRTHCPRMERIVNSFICDNFMDISHTDQFLTLDCSAINWMLINHYIRVSEAAMLDSLVRWYKHKEQERETDFKWLFQRINLLDLIGKDVLSELIKKYQLVKVIPELRKYKKLLPQRVQLEELIYKENISNIAVFAYKERMNIKDPGLYNFDLKYWAPFVYKSMAPKCQIEAEAFSEFIIQDAIPLYNSVYLFYTRTNRLNGTRTSSLLMRVDNQLQSVTKCATNDGLYSYAMAVPCGIFIYFLGGKDGCTQVRTVYRYDTVRDSWSEMQPMIGEYSSDYDKAVAYDNRFLYAFGRFFSERYDILTNTWTPLTPPWESNIVLPEGGGQVDVIYRVISAECLGDRISICIRMWMKPFRELSSFRSFYDPLNDTWESPWMESPRDCKALKKCFGNNFALYHKWPIR